MLFEFSEDTCVVSCNCELTSALFVLRALLNVAITGDRGVISVITSVCKAALNDGLIATNGLVCPEKLCVIAIVIS